MLRCRRMRQRETQPRKKERHDTGAQNACTTVSLPVSWVLVYDEELDTYHGQIKNDTGEQSTYGGRLLIRVSVPHRRSILTLRQS